MSQIGGRQLQHLQGLLVCGVGDEGKVDQAIKSDINIKMLTDLAPTIIWTRAVDGKVTYLNTFWFDFTGMDPNTLDQAVIDRFVHPEDKAAIDAAFVEGQAHVREYKSECRIMRHDGEYRWFQFTGRPVFDEDGNHVQWMGAGAIVEDLKRAKLEALQAREEAERAHLLLEQKVAERTRDLEETNERLLIEIEERQKTQDALRQAQKMESVGQLTGGIAHDFNNMLAVIMGNLELLKMSLPNLGDNSTVRRMDRNVAMALEGALKAEKLTSQLLAFSRKARLHPERLNVNEVVNGVKEMVDRAIGVKVACELDLQDDIWLCLSDKTQLESAIINLAINARDAMPSGGSLCIISRNKEISEQRYVSVSVRDTGEGINEETLSRVFEPFFTTKDVGKGSGLGLSMVHGFCQQSNGKVFIESKVGVGTTVEMIFPFTSGGSIMETQDEEDFNYDDSKPSILVVDDEPAVRELACQLLTDIGYNVVSAEDGQGAIRVLEDPMVPLDLLFTDVVMPGGLDGFEVAEIARRSRPEMPIIFTTGHAEIALKELKKDLSRKIKVIGKPYRLDELRQLIAQELTK